MRLVYLKTMNVEKTMEFILQMQAAAETRLAKADERMDRAESRMDRAEARMDKFDRRLEAIGKLLQTGMKILVKIEEAQRKTDRKLDRLLDSWAKRPPNGHRPKR